MTGLDWLAEQARARPDHPALVCDGTVRTFRALDAEVALLARRLVAAGVVPGDRVAALLPNGPTLVTLLHAAPRIGAATVLLDPRLSAPEVAAQIRLARPALVLTDAAHADATGGRVAVVAGDEAPLAGVVPAPDPRPARFDLAAPHTILFTSGTSGMPKAVVLTAANHLASALGSAARLGLHRDDRWLACLPLVHVGGLSIVLRGAITGTTVVLHRRFDAHAVARALAADAVSLVSLVPTMLARLLPLLGAAPRLRVVLLGGAAAPPDLLAAARERGLPVATTYGLTEAASQVATAAPGDAAVIPLAHTRVRIAGGDEGEIRIAAPTVMAGYLAADGRVQDATIDGWLPTGDRGRLDPLRGLVVLGRCDDVIVTGGENVDPAEVEGVLRAHPAVADVGVAGLPDAEWGQAVTAWVVADPAGAPTLDTLRHTCRQRLAPHKLPRRLVLVDALPRTPTGKLRRAALRAGWPFPS